MRNLSSSEKQWILSFLLVDAIFWLFVLGSCVMNPVDCLEAASFGPAVFYVPFWLLSPDFGSIGGYGVSLVTGPIIGLLCHILLGFGIGYCLRKKPVQWLVSIFVAFFILYMIISISFKIAFTTGFFS